MERLSRAKKARHSIEEMKAMRQKGGSRLASMNFDEDDDVYELVDEENYQKIVEDRRKAADFVVDDNGLGYYDDGEEVLGVGEDAYDAKKRAKEAAKNGDLRASKKARKLAEMSSAPVSARNTILRHMHTGVNTNASTAGTSKNNAPQELLDVDSLMGSAAPRPTGATSIRRNVTGRPLSRPPVPPRRVSIKAETETLEHMEYDNTVSDDQFMDTGPEPDFGDNEVSAEPQDVVTTDSNVTSPDDADDTNKSMDDTIAAPNQSVSSSDIKVHPPKEAPKLSLTKSTKKLKASAPLSGTGGSSAGGGIYFKPDLSDASSGSLRALAGIESVAMPGQGNDSTSSLMAPMAGSKIDPSLWIKKHSAEVKTESPTEGGENAHNAAVDQDYEYTDMFWMDACENNGIIYLFGKVQISDNSDGGSSSRFVSCCVVVHGCERNLFVLPRTNPDTFNAKDNTANRLGLAEVYNEINKMLVPHIVPRMQGQTFRCKTVRRKYAFEHGSVPREETEYLKVVYFARHGVPTTAQCQGGQTYERIFGATSSVLELFLLKRKLMGPSWIRIKRPRINNDAVSWCKVEMTIDDPKLVSKLTKPHPPPPLVSMSISMKTAVNPSTHLHEIIMLSGVIHTKVECEADSEVSPKLLRRFTIVRQLGVSCGSTYPSTFPHDLQKAAKDVSVQAVLNERCLLSLFLARMQHEDPDIITSHNLLGFECDVLLARAVANKLPNWSLLGRLRRSKPPRNANERDVAAGRILCDTYKAAKEFLRETTYSLTHLALSQLKQQRTEVDPVDVPRYFSSSQDIIKLALTNAYDAMLVQGLMLKLQVIPLTKQLTCLSGNLWSRTIKGARAERIEYLLLHEFHALKYILPERKPFENQGGSSNKKGRNAAGDGEDADLDNELDNKVGGMSRKRAKAAYAGGLVLEPKKGLYDTYILLLDFNSLYPSIIQEYNLCFTTIEWTKYLNESNEAVKPTDSGNNKKRSLKKPDKDGEASGDEGEDDDDAPDNDGPSGGSAKALPPLPDVGATSTGILPKVIKALVDRRRAVKDLLKKEKDVQVKQQLDIRQKALKLTANSMYGCLGFSFSRFYARPIAALVTAMGREALQRTVDLATNSMALDVIYGDTDSVMINTGITDLKEVKDIGMKVKKEVNKLYRSLELDLDGIFKSMLLLKKKKYAALVINEGSDGKVTLEKEMKGLDLVRRDWCGISKKAGAFVVDQILSGKPREDIVIAIHDHLTELSTKMRTGELDLEGFVVTKGLNKNPKDYPDCKGQAHLQVALQMLKANKPVNIGDHIPYVICSKGPDGAATAAEGNVSAAQRACHPDDVIRAAPGQYILDYEWYLSTQILPPISRLCEPIEGTSPAILSECLGLDAAKYAKASHHADELLEDGWGFTPKCQMDDAERFKNCVPLKCTCCSCGKESDVRSVMNAADGGYCLSCENCGAKFYGKRNGADIYCYLSNLITLQVRACMRRYYDCWLVCDDHSCGRRTMQQSVRSLSCTENCHGRMVQEYDEAALHTQLKYLESLFDVSRLQSKKKLKDADLRLYISDDKLEVLRLLKQHMSNSVNGSAYNWVRPSLWSSLFGKLTASSGNATAATTKKLSAGTAAGMTGVKVI